MTPLFVLNIESLNAASFTAELTNHNDSSEIVVIGGDPVTDQPMAVNTPYGPYTAYMPDKYPDDPTTYCGGQVMVMLQGQQCGPPTNQYVTTVFLNSDENGDLLEAWAFNVSMTPANPRSGSRAQFATFTAAYGSKTTTPNAYTILSDAMSKNAGIKIVQKDKVNTWTFSNGQCFEVNFNISVGG